jgi:hypothetical protein
MFAHPSLITCKLFIDFTLISPEGLLWSAERLGDAKTFYCEVLDGSASILLALPMDFLLESGELSSKISLLMIVESKCWLFRLLA